MVGYFKVSFPSIASLNNLVFKTTFGNRVIMTSPFVELTINKLMELNLSASTFLPPPLPF